MEILKKYDLMKLLYDRGLISKKTLLEAFMGEDYSTNWNGIISALNSEESSPIAMVENLIYEEEGVRTKTAYRCDVCKKTPCKHFEIEDGHPKLTKEAELINKLAGSPRPIHTQPSAQGEPTRIC